MNKAYFPLLIFILMIIVGCSESNNNTVDNTDNILETVQELKYQEKKRIRTEYLEKFDCIKAKKWIAKHYKGQLKIETIWCVRLKTQ